MKELVPMDDFASSKYEVLIKKPYELLESIDNDWCDMAYDVLKELDELADCATCNNAAIRQEARDKIHELSLRFGMPCLDFCMTLASCYIERQDLFSEKDVCAFFQQNYKKFLGREWNVVQRKNHPKHKPDFWVSNGTEDVPVECKLGDFNEKAKQQLLRYVTVYNKQHGIAVATGLKCELPDNIRFIQVIWTS